MRSGDVGPWPGWGARRLARRAGAVVLLGVCIGVCSPGARAVEAAEPGTAAAAAVPADPAITSLLHRLERQIFAGHVTAPPYENAVATWQLVKEKIAQPASRGVVTALTDFIGEARTHSAQQQSAGNAVIATDLLTFANMAADALDNGHAGQGIVARSAPGQEQYRPPVEVPMPRAADPLAGQAITHVALSNAVAPPQRQPAEHEADAGAGNPAQHAPPVRDASVAATYLQRGNDMLAIKDISAARKYFAFAVDAGSAPAAAALARTYDPNYLAGLGVIGVQPDTAQAAAWYRKAAALGDTGAQVPLRVLGAQAAR